MYRRCNRATGQFLVNWQSEGCCRLHLPAFQIAVAIAPPRGWTGRVLGAKGVIVCTFAIVAIETPGGRVALLITNTVAYVPVVTCSANTTETVGPTLATDHPVALAVFPCAPTTYALTVLREEWHVAGGRAAGAWSSAWLRHQCDSALINARAIATPRLSLPRLAAIKVVSRHVADGITFAVANPLSWTDVESTHNRTVISLVVRPVSVSVRVVLDGHIRSCHCHFPAISVVELVSNVVAQVITFAIAKPVPWQTSFRLASS